MVRPGRRRGALLLLAGFVVALIAAATPVRAQQPGAPAAELGLEVLVGHGGQPSGSRWAPVEVVVEPARLLQGHLTVATRSTSGATSEVVAIEAAARTRRVYRFLVPNGPVTVRIDEPGREPVEVRGQRPESPRGFAVGYLGAAVPAGAPEVRSEPTGLTGSWVPVAPEWLAISPHALDPLGGLVVPDAALGALPPAFLDGLRSAVTGGLDLVVVADGTGQLADLGLPAPASSVVPAPGAPGGRALEPAEGAWSMTVGDLAAIPGSAVGGVEDGQAVIAVRTTAGRGTVAVTSVGPGEGEVGGAALWSLLAGPPEHVNVRPGEWEADVVPHQLERVFSTDASSAPTLPWLALFTVAYILVVGPVNGVVLSRMGRRELAWATIPVVTVVFTAAAFFGVSGSRPPEGLAGRVLVALDGVGTELVAAGVRAPTEGTRTIALDGEGWTARALTSGGRPSVLRRTAGGVQADLDLGGLQFGGLVASRPTEALPPLEIEAVSGAEGVTARVRNTGARPLDGVMLHTATTTRSVGALAPGEEREVELTGTALQRVGAYRDPFQRIGSAEGASLEALLHGRFLDGSPGTAWAVAALPGGGADVRVAGLPPEDRGLLLVAGTSVRDDGALSPFAVHRKAYSPQRRGTRASALAFDDLEAAVLRFQLPGGVAASQLRAQLDTSEGGLVRTVDAYLATDGRWVGVAETFPDGIGDPGELVDPLGVVWVRVEGDLFPFDYSGTSIDGLAEAGR